MKKPNRNRTPQSNNQKMRKYNSEKKNGKRKSNPIIPKSGNPFISYTQAKYSTYAISLGFTRFYKIRMRFHKFSFNFNRFHKMSTGLIRFHENNKSKPETQI